MRLLERHRPASGTATPAGVPIGSSVRRPVLVVSESLECAGGILREDSRKESLLRVCSACSTTCSRSLSLQLTSDETSSGIRFGGAWTDLTAGSLVASDLISYSFKVSQNGSYLVDPASSHMLVSKIKPCMSKYKLLYTVKLRMAH